MENKLSKYLAPSSQRDESGPGNKKTKAKGLEIQAENGFIHAHMPGIQSFQWVKFCPNNIQGQEGQQLKMRRWRSTLGIGRHCRSSFLVWS